MHLCVQISLLHYSMHVHNYSKSRAFVPCIHSMHSAHVKVAPSKGAQALDLTYITGRTRQDMGGRWWINNGEIRQNLPLESRFDVPKNRLIVVAFF